MEFMPLSSFSIILGGGGGGCILVDCRLVSVYFPKRGGRGLFHEIDGLPMDVLIF